jgi:hypothetical protein
MPANRCRETLPSTTRSAKDTKTEFHQQNHLRTSVAVVWKKPWLTPIHRRRVERRKLA